MSIELKYKLKYPYAVIIFTALSLFFGVAGISYGITGLITLPLTAAFLGMLMCVEKKKIASITVSAILIVGEFILGFFDYFTLTSLSSVAVAIIISAFYLKKKDKFTGAILTTLVISFMIFASAAIFIICTTEVSSVSEAYEYFLDGYNAFKDSVTSSTMEMMSQSPFYDPTFSVEYISLALDVYLNCIVALVTVLAFILVGLTYKMFCKLVGTYSENKKGVNSWQFIPHGSFAYFYFALLVLSMFSMNTESVISVSIANLYIIFMVIFAYVGYSFSIVMLGVKGIKKPLSSIIVLALVLLLSSLAMQILAALGAFITVKYSRFTKHLQSKK